QINISQPSISTAIGQLEAEFGAQLFLRRPSRGLSLTPMGEELLLQARKLINQAEAMYLTATEARKSGAEAIRLGCLPTLAPLILPGLIQSFAEDRPDIAITPTVTDHEAILARLACGEMELALTYDLLVPPGYDFTPLASLPTYVLVGAGDPLAMRGGVALEELAVRGLVLLDLPITRDYFLSLFLRRGITPKIAARLSQPEVIRAMVANGFGYTLANARPRSSGSPDGGSVVRLHLYGDHRPMQLGLLRCAKRPRRAEVETFETHCAAMISDDDIPGMEIGMHRHRKAS
ncbi:MAG TPA: LysR family transcriptional regulator, partial [Paenirhodobacter sp.]